MLKRISGLLRSSKPAMFMAVFIAVVGVTGTAYAGKHHSSNGDKALSKPSKPFKHLKKLSNGNKSDKSKWDTNGNNDKNDKHHQGNGDGDHGDHNPPAAQYGVGTVNVSRGGAPATAWATYSTALGSPVGDTTGGVFRFTCTTAQAPCTVAVAAAVLSSSPGTAKVYPRVLIYREDYNSGGPEYYCEYGDGSTGTAPFTLTKQALSATPTYTAMQINIGGSADCGGPVATAGDVNVITVPSGYYDVHATFAFLS